MIILEVCFLCKKERSGPWTLLFGPPSRDFQTQCDSTAKFHICPDCYNHIIHPTKRLTP